MTKICKQCIVAALTLICSATAPRADDDPRVPELEARLRSAEAKLDRLLGILDELSGRSAKNRAEPRYEGRPLSEHVIDLGDRSKYRRNRAQQALVECGPEATPVLLAALGSGDSLLRASTIQTLGANLNEPRARAAVLAALAGRDRAMGGYAAWSIASALSGDSNGWFDVQRLRARSVIREVREALLAAITSPDLDIRLEAACALLSTTESEELLRKVPLQLFLDQLERTDRPIRELSRKIAQGLGRLGPRAREAVPSLIALLKNPEKRIAAVESLGTLGALSAEAVPALKDLEAVMPLEPDDTGFREEDMDTLQTAIWGIESSEPEEPVNEKEEDK